VHAARRSGTEKRLDHADDGSAHMVPLTLEGDSAQEQVSGSKEAPVLFDHLQHCDAGASGTVM
jgi:hypothetical protein